MAVLAPTESASVRMTVVVNPGLRLSWCTAKRRSRARLSRKRPNRIARTSSLTCSMPPNSMSACCRASRCESPSFIFVSVNSSTEEFNSSSKACSTMFLRRRFRNRETIRPGMIPPSDSSGFHRRRHDLDYLVPIPFLGLELCSSRGRQPVVFGSAVIFRGAPLGFHPSLLFHAMQRREKRAKTHLERSPSDLRNATRDADPVQGFQRQRFQNQQVQRSTQKI